MGLALLGILLIGTVTGAFFVVHAWNRRRFQEGMLIVRWGLAIWAAYLATLVAVSLVTPNKDATGGEARFCGIDPDCALSASVTQIDYVKTVGNPPNELIADGMFYLVTVRVLGISQDQGTLPALTGVVVDDLGREFGRSANGERAILASQDPALQVARGSWRTTMVFDLPKDIERPALILNEGSVLERVFELFLIGDEASLLHPKTKLRLLKPEERSGY